MKLNKEELLMGALVGFAYLSVIKWWALLAMPVCAVLWALGGTVNKAYRRFGVAFVMGLVAGWAMRSPYAGAMVAFATGVVMAIGYGVPTWQPPDKGSWLGRFFFQKAGQNPVLTDIYVRATVGALFGLACLPLASVNLLGWVGGTMALVVGMPAIAVLVEGEVNV